MRPTFLSALVGMIFLTSCNSGNTTEQENVRLPGSIDLVYTSNGCSVYKLTGKHYEYLMNTCTDEMLYRPVTSLDESVITN